MPVPVSDLATQALATTLVNNTDELMVNLNAAAAGTTTFGPFYNPKRALRLAIGIAAIAAGSITVTLLGYDQSSGLTWTIIASTAIAATGLTRIAVGPDFVAAANVNAQDYAPAYYEIQVAIVTGPVTATIGAHGIGA
jgi:hypothetical protein